MPTQKHKSKRKQTTKRDKFWTFDITAGTLVGIILSVVLTAVVSGILNNAPPPYLEVDRTTDFLDWDRTGEQNDLILNEGKLFLDPDAYTTNDQPNLRDPQGYIQSSNTISEHSFVCYKFIPRISEIDFTIRSKNNFLITIGDGDDQSIRLKRFSSVDNNWVTVRPDDIHATATDDQDRYRLDSPIPLNQDTTICLTINANGGGVTKKIITELSIFQNGKPITLGNEPSWTLTSEEKTNGFTQYGVGLIDSRGVHPEVELRGYCAVEMDKDKNEPTMAQREACQNP